MCVVCRIVGRNIFSDVDADHDVDVDEEVTGDTLWHVWRRGDGFVGVSNVTPSDVSDGTYRYHLLGVVADPLEAEGLVALALRCN